MDDLNQVSIGPDRRRLWTVVLAAAALWIGVVVVLDNGKDTNDASAPATATTPSTPSTATNEPPATQRSTTSTIALPGAPLLGRPTGWSLVVENSPAVTRVIDLDTGAVELIELANIVASNADGVVAGSPVATWHPFPLDDATAVPLGDNLGLALLVPGRDVAWITDYRQNLAQPPRARLVSLTDGTTALEVPIAASVYVVGLAGGSLVLSAGGNGVLVDPNGARRELPEGQPMGAMGDSVVLSTCESLDCRTLLYDVTTGATSEITELLADPFSFISGPTHPDGSMVVVGRDGNTPRPSLLGPDGLLPLLPPDIEGSNVHNGVWTPDGALLLVPTRGAVAVIDPFAAGGPVQVSSFDIRSATGATLAIMPTP